jgi:hypothetical protein
MTKITFVIGLVGAALVLAAPAVGVVPPVGDDGAGYTAPTRGAAVVKDYPSEPAGNPDFWNYDANGQKVANASPGLGPDQLAQQFAGAGGVDASIVAPDAVDRAVAARQASSGASSRSLVFDNYRVEAQPSSRPAVTSTDSGWGDWPQFGIGFALGIVAMVALLFAMRHMRIRPLAH